MTCFPSKTIKNSTSETNKSINVLSNVETLKGKTVATFEEHIRPVFGTDSTDFGADLTIFSVFRR